MLDPILVDRAAFFPNRAIDGTSEGPFVDTHIEQAQQRIYLSQKHARYVGLASGLLVDKTALDAANERIAELDQALTMASQRIAELELGQPRVVPLDELLTLISVPPDDPPAPAPVEPAVEPVKPRASRSKAAAS